MPAGDNRCLDVLHIVESLGHGGAEQNLLSLVRVMPRARFRQHLAYLEGDTVLLESFRPHLETVFQVPARGGLAGQTLQLARWMRRHRPDVVHTQLARAQLVARAAALLGGRRPVVTTWQNVLYAPESTPAYGGPWRQKLFRLLDRATCPLNHSFIAVSETVAGHCTDALAVDEKRVHVIYNTVEPRRVGAIDPALLAATRARLGLAPSTSVLVSIGRLVPAKRHLDLVDAMPAVLQRHADTVLLVAGPGPLYHEIEARIHAHALGDRVRLLGRRDDAPVLLGLADVFLLPSLHEGLSVALIEALACGVPAIASDIPQNREAARDVDTVRFVAPGDVDGFAAAIGAFLDDGAALAGRAAMQAAAVQARFAPAMLAAKFGDVLVDAATAR